MFEFLSECCDAKPHPVVPLDEKYMLGYCSRCEDKASFYIDIVERGGYLDLEEGDAI